MTDTKNWTLACKYNEYYDFDKELYALPDEADTSIDMRLTFHTETRTCYYTITIYDDHGDIRAWEKTHNIAWAVGLEMLRRDNTTIPEELTK
jgi:hypothetical protein